MINLCFDREQRFVVKIRIIRLFRVFYTINTRNIKKNITMKNSCYSMKTTFNLNKMYGYSLEPVRTSKNSKKCVFFFLIKKFSNREIRVPTIRVPVLKVVSENRFRNQFFGSRYPYPLNSSIRRFLLLFPCS